MNNQSTCHPAPADKKGYIKELGSILVKEQGKKKYYKPEEVKKAHKKSTYYYLDFSCWGMSVFSSHSDFDKYHESTGEMCDYTAMKAEMLQGLSVATSEHWMDIPNLDMDASWLDFGDVFEGIFEGIGEFIAGLFDGL